MDNAKYDPDPPNIDSIVDVHFYEYIILMDRQNNVCLWSTVIMAPVSKVYVDWVNDPQPWWDNLIGLSNKCPTVHIITRPDIFKYIIMHNKAGRNKEWIPWDQIIELYK